MDQTAQVQRILTLPVASGFARLALRNLVREFPNHPGHLMTGPTDWKTPREWHPIFFGCFDWHSAVHGYWLLARLRRLFPALPEGGAIAAHFDHFVTRETVAVEIEYFNRPHCRNFERPYGWAWLLMLCSELSRHEDGAGKKWKSILQPLAELIRERFLEFFPKAHYPLRAGTHGNLAFALVLTRDYAVACGDEWLINAVDAKARQWFLGDRNCQAWEPSLSDFLSPALMEAECMRQVLPFSEYQTWLAEFLPGLSKKQPTVLFEPVVPSDRTDGQIAHLDGLNFSRAWCLHGISQAFVADQATAVQLRDAANKHIRQSLPHISADYAGEHWLATFALLAIG